MTTPQPRSESAQAPSGTTDSTAPTASAETDTASPAAPDTPADMRSIVQREFGTDAARLLRVDRLPVPTAGPGEVLVQVGAVSIDRGTWHMMAGLPYPIRLAGFGVRRPKHANPGRSLAGTVVAVGSDVTAFAPGDRVYGSADAALAEYAVVDAAKLAAAPSGLSFEDAAAVPISGLTALQAVRDRARVQEGQTVLVIGASGGVGSFAVQIAKAAGARVTGVASTAKLDLVRSLGADDVLDYTVDDITDGERRYDVIIDTGGNRSLTDLRRALTPTGTLVIVGGENGGRWLGGTDRGLRAHVLSLFVSQRLGTFISSENAADLDALRELVESGDVRAAVDRIYPLEDTAEAIDQLVSGRAGGKIVVTMPVAA